jgi:hypothetical protein
MVLSRKALAAAVVSLVLAAPVLAQQLTEAPLVEEGAGLVLTTNEHVLTLPLPDWLTPAERLSGDIMPLVNATYRADANQALLEIYPMGQSAEDWSTLYGARITLEASRPLTDYRNAVMHGYSQTCNPKLSGFFQFGEDDGETLAPLGYVCGAYLDRLEGYAGEGEVMVVAFAKSEKGVAVVYQEWRGPMFDPSNPETWPVSTDVLEARAEELQAEADLRLAD